MHVLRTMFLAFSLVLPGLRNVAAQSGAPDPSFEAMLFPASDSPLGMATDAQGRIYLWGDLSASSNPSISDPIRLSPSGEMDSTFSVAGITASGTLGPVVPDPDSGGVWIHRPSGLEDFRLSESGELLETFQPRPDPSQSVALESGGYLSMGTNLQRWDSQLNPDHDFVPPVASLTNPKLLKLSDGRVLLIGRTSVWKFFILSADGSQLLSESPIQSPDPTLFFDKVTAATEMPDGKILLAGLYANVGNRRFFARYNLNGQRDAAFETGFVDWEQVDEIAMQQDGKLLLRGRFSSRTTPVHYLPVIRIHPDGSLDPTFDFLTENPLGNLVSYFPVDMELLPSGKLLLLMDQMPVTIYNIIGRVESTHLYRETRSTGVPPRLLRLHAENPQPPHRPRILDVASPSTTTNAITWQAVPNTDFYRVEKFWNGDWIPLGETEETTFEDTTGDGATLTAYRIFAVNATGTSFPSEPMTESLDGISTMSWGPNLQILAPNRVQLSWADVDGEEAYEIFRTEGWINTSLLLTDTAEFIRSRATLLATVDANVTQWVDETAEPETAYSYAVVPVNSAGAAAFNFSLVQTPPASPLRSPLDFEAAPNADGSILLIWSHVPRAEGYLLEWKTAPDGNWETLADLPNGSTSFTTRAGPLPLSSHEFRITAEDALGRTSPSTTKTTRIPPAGWIPPGSLETPAPERMTFRVIHNVQMTSDGGFLVDAETESSELVSFYSGNQHPAIGTSTFEIVYVDLLDLPKTTTRRIFKLNSEGSEDSSFGPTFDPSRENFVTLKDGRILSFSKTFGTRIRTYSKLGLPSTLDSRVETFATSQGSGTINWVVQLRDGSLVSGGSFEGHIQKSNSLGVRDPHFALDDLSLNAGPRWLLERSDGKLLVGIDSTTVACLFPNGSLDTNFGNAGFFVANAPIHSHALQSDDSLILGGETQYQGLLGLGSSALVRIRPDGTPDPFWKGFLETPQTLPVEIPPYGALVQESQAFTISRLLVDSQDRVLAVLSFNRPGSDTKQSLLMRFLPSGSRDPSFSWPVSDNIPAMFEPNGGGYAIFTNSLQLTRAEGMIPEPTGNFQAMANSGESLSLSWEDSSLTLEMWDSNLGQWVAISHPGEETSLTLEGLEPSSTSLFRFKRGTEAFPYYSEIFRQKTLSPFEVWKRERQIPDSGSGLVMDPLTAYAFGIDPHNPDASKLPGLDFSTSPGTFRFKEVRPELVYQVEYSKDMLTWTKSEFARFDAQSGEVSLDFRNLPPDSPVRPFFPTRIESFTNFYLRVKVKSPQ